MKAFLVRKQDGGEHHKIFIRKKLPRPKLPLVLLTNVTPIMRRICISEMDFVIKE